MLFSMRAPRLVITSLVAQLVSYPLGVAWAKVMPSRRFKLIGQEFSFNPGPFNMKEHTVIVVMANCTFGGGVAYSTDTILAQRAFYGQNWGWGFELLLTISTQCLGYGIAGLMRKFLVRPGQFTRCGYGNQDS
jgi:OPT family oligopeptide transporter